MSGPSVALAKECVNRAFEGGLAEGVGFERRIFHSLFATEDQKEGMDAFLNKRKPVFKHALNRLVVQSESFHDIGNGALPRRYFFAPGCSLESGSWTTPVTHPPTDGPPTLSDATRNPP